MFPKGFSGNFDLDKVNQRHCCLESGCNNVDQICLVLNSGKLVLQIALTTESQLLLQAKAFYLEFFGQVPVSLQAAFS